MARVRSALSLSSDMAGLATYGSAQLAALYIPRVRVQSEPISKELKW
jgi:hypothetical protein